MAMAGLAVLVGCASLAPSMEKPRLHLVDLQPISGGSMEAAFRMDLRVINPNDFPLEIRGLDCQLDVNGRNLAAGVSDAELSVPRYGTALLPVTVYSSMADVLMVVIRLARDAERSGGAPEVRYRLAGHLRVLTDTTGSFRLGFASEGELAPEELRGAPPAKRQP
jgi:LEA14-like dessication related protein